MELDKKSTEPFRISLVSDTAMYGSVRFEPTPFSVRAPAIEGKFTSVSKMQRELRKRTL